MPSLHFPMANQVPEGLKKGIIVQTVLKSKGIIALFMHGVFCQNVKGLNIEREANPPKSSRTTLLTWANLSSFQGEL